MPKVLSSLTHGVLDYVTAGTLLALPRILGWSTPTTALLTAMAAATVVYSLVTRYELGPVKLLPMPAHLALDVVSALALLVAAATVAATANGELPGLIILGLFELVVTAVTDPKVPEEFRGPA